MNADRYSAVNHHGSTPLGVHFFLFSTGHTARCARSLPGNYGVEPFGSMPSPSYIFILKNFYNLFAQLINDFYLCHNQTIIPSQFNTLNL
jgi:hypothetical protein